jgi:DNA-binding NtrC family response regulator
VTPTLRLLLIEDSADDAALVVRELTRGGYDVDVERVDTPEGLVAALKRQAWDIAVADYTMPGFTGTAALTLLRQHDADLPFIFVSGTIGEDAAVAAMRTGADDYLMKGALKRLIPAVEREMRDAGVRRERRRVEAPRPPGVSRPLTICRTARSCTIVSTRRRASPPARTARSRCCTRPERLQGSTTARPPCWRPRPAVRRVEAARDAARG